MKLSQGEVFVVWIPGFPNGRFMLFSGSDTVTTCLVLLDLYKITAPGRSASQHRGINSDVDLVVLGRRAQYARIFR